ncbi:MAG: NAD(P)-dependent oxidoreductase [Pirellulales bacterium]|jgi:3-hydroxyisobutyrate dehydrogenase|nr:NAD(P)-dependent oxidoreductase [Pirellulales bacterium]HJN67074.1 NAD(P)-dependent oxidoreductase [Pirellulales bacterium]
MEISPANTHLGWIGVGVMGQSMCGHLLDAGFEVSLHNRTKQKADALLDRGARWRAAVAEVAESADIVFTMLGYPHDVRQVYLDDNGLLASSRPGTILIDMTTSQPLLAKQIAQQAAVKDITVIDAPVSGGDVGARDATLSIMIGGPEETCDALDPCWQALGSTIVYQGEAGMGQHTKMVNQTLIASGMVGLCEALLYGYRAGLNMQQVLQSVAGGAAGSWSLSNLGPRILANNFDPGFFVEHFIKDMGIALEEARRMKLSMPGLALAHELYIALAAQGHSRSGTQALQVALATASGIDWQNR